MAPRRDQSTWVPKGADGYKGYSLCVVKKEDGEDMLVWIHWKKDHDPWRLEIIEA